MSNQTSILWPVFALAAWTLLILLLVAFRRLSATFTGKTSPNAYALGESAKVPLAAVLANRNYMNLLELPLLFYVGCLTAYVTGGASLSMLALSWSYVALRVVHSLIHVSYNHIMHRFAAFSASNFALVIFWVLLAGKVMQT